MSAWAARQSDLVAVLLVGSRARGDAQPDSDWDLVLLAQDPANWLAGDWIAAFGTSVQDALEDYGRLTSRRVRYVDGTEVEFGITGVDWITNPDEGTWDVLRGGVVVLWDPQRLFEPFVNESEGPPL